MTNILEAIQNISQLEEMIVRGITSTNNRITSVGEGLESFVKDSFANTFKEADKKERLKKYSEVFSYQGSKKTPPDLMLKGGDAIEIKKTETLSAELQLNSSHPKSKLFSSSSLINKHCRICELWETKDFIYAVGHVPKETNIISSIWFVYGSVYAADEEVYLNLKNTLSKNIQAMEDIDFSPTNEIG